ncbi:hypothetical protein [Acetobacter oeni]|uniref:hypothetical protein n=1 Tax=Acetobacter oeni TaxID=304077 RepID=UPI0011BFBDBA|nr:hypothetical protein [Acetobacter oeni]MBB3883612.1 hypothetical protein [Acetobacter oeni]NHO19653.1 hypothetical protein [Acetobacter oeni]
MKLRVETFGSVSAFDREKDMALRALTCLSDTPSPDGRVFSAYLFVLSERGDRHRIVHHITMDIWTDDRKIAHVQERHYARMLKKQNDLTEEIRNLALNAWAQAGLPLNPKCQFRSRTDSLLQRPAPTDFTQSGPEQSPYQNIPQTSDQIRTNTNPAPNPASIPDNNAQSAATSI